MNWYDQAQEKLEKESKNVKGKMELAMMSAVRDTLLNFCQQDDEFAQAIVQGGSLQDCLSSVAKGVGNSISDLEAYKRAVTYYFPGADIRMTMTIDLCGDIGKAEDSAKSTGILLNFRDFL